MPTYTPRPPHALMQNLRLSTLDSRREWDAGDSCWFMIFLQGLYNQRTDTNPPGRPLWISAGCFRQQVAQTGCRCHQPSGWGHVAPSWSRPKTVWHCSSHKKHQKAKGWLMNTSTTSRIYFAGTFSFSWYLPVYSTCIKIQPRKVAWWCLIHVHTYAHLCDLSVKLACSSIGVQTYIYNHTYMCK